ncbi:MAG: penicillin-binding protein activator LpoB [Muribaculaceae bacterium]|nr:penicillin-binding protein activator LpoB [Muribaculaceae bacterium]
MKRIFSILAFLFIFCSVVVGQQRSIAVYVVGNDNSSIKPIEGAIISELSLNGKFRIADRSDAIEAVIAKEYSKQSSGSVDLEQIMKLGRQIGAQYLLVADLDYHSYGSITNVVAKLINLEENSVVAATDWSGIITIEKAPSVGKLIAKNILRNLSKKYSTNSKKPMVIGPLTFQDAIDYQIPKGYISTVNNGDNGPVITFREAINKLYEANIFVRNPGFVVGRSKRNVSDIIHEEISYNNTGMVPFSNYESSIEGSDDYYTYNYKDSKIKDVEYRLKCDKKNNCRYYYRYYSKWRPEEKGYLPGGNYYFILVPIE